MLHLANPNLAPPGSFRLRCKDLALINPKLADVGPFHALKEMADELNKRRKANGLPQLPDEEIQHRLCQHQPPGVCRDELNHPTVAPGSGSLSLATVIQGTTTLAGWFVRGRRRVSDDEIVRRSYICNSCPLHTPISGCQGCSGNRLRQVVNEIVGGRSLPTDAMLQACGVCQCSLVSKTRMPLDDLLPHMSSEQQRQLWEKCWLRETVAEPAVQPADPPIPYPNLTRPT